MDATSTWPLRPLGIGEIFDRAVTIYVRNFVIFTLMVMTVLVPLSVAQYVLQPDQTAQITQMIDVIQHPDHAKTAKAPTNTPSLGAVLFFLVVLLAALVVSPFANNAVAVGVAGIYFGRDPRFGRCFATVFRRWLPMIGLFALLFAIVIAVYIAIAMMFFAIALVGIGLVAHALPFAIATFVFGALLLFVVLAAVMLLTVTFTFACYGVILENQGPVTALSTAFARIFSRQELGKALLVGLAILGIQLGVFTASGIVGVMILLLIKSTVLYLAINALVGAVLSAFSMVLLSVYYYDVRTRREGLDLEADLTQLATA